MAKESSSAMIFSWLSVAFLGIPWPSFAAPAPPPRVLVARYAGVISPAAAEYLRAAIESAARMDARALLIELDTPGGLDSSMRRIVQAELSSRVPVIVYVWPPGARAASAGVFIAMAADVAAMAPGTNIGAAHPVQIGGGGIGGLPGVKEKEAGPDKTLEAKIENDAAAYLRSIASRRGRNVDWAAWVVRKSSSVTAAEAVKLHVVDLKADGPSELLADVDGRSFPGLKGLLRTQGAELVPFPMSRRQKILATVSDPNVAMILMTLGATGLLIELYSPGLIFPGVVGAAALTLAFYSFDVLGASPAGLLLIGLGLILFLLELKIPSYGLLTAGGLSAFVLGSLLLARSGPPGLAPSPAGLSFDAAVIAGAALLLLLTARKVLRRKSPVGLTGMAGAVGEAVSPLSPLGIVRVLGESWRAESLEGDIPAGARIRVESAEGLTLKVRRADR